MMRAHTIVTGLAFGDEGKGSCVDWLARQRGSGAATVVVRHNGGPQAAHHVVLPDGRVHCFAQLGSASFVPGARTLHSRFMLVEPMALWREAQALERLGVQRVCERVVMDRRCVLVTPYHRALNRMQELARGRERHGSCGLGVGQAWLDATLKRAPSVTVAHAEELQLLRHKLQQQRLAKLDVAEQLVARHPELSEHLEVFRARDLLEEIATRLHGVLTQQGITRDEGESLQRALSQGGVIFEGAQGVLLDAKWGFFPHVTATRTTTHNANLLLQEAGASSHEVQRLGLLRAYGTRHGAGPFPGEQAELGAAFPELHNAHNAWQGAWRVGGFDAVLARWALARCGDIDALVLSHVDAVAKMPTARLITHYNAAQDLPLPAHPTLEAMRTLGEALTRATLTHQELALPPLPPHTSPCALADHMEPLIARIEALLGARVGIVSCGATHLDKRIRG